MDGSADRLYKCKLVMVGDQAVGKSSLVLQFVNNTFQDNYKCTIGASFLTKKVGVDDKILQFDIWDTAGLERFQSIIPMYYRGAHVAVIVYDVTKTESFTRAKAWVNEIKSKAETVNVIALAGNKSDQTDIKMIPYEEGQKYATEKDLIFFETSAKTSQNVNKFFLEIAKQCANKNAWTEPASNLRKQIQLEEKKPRRKFFC